MIENGTSLHKVGAKPVHKCPNPLVLTKSTMIGKTPKEVARNGSKSETIANYRVPPHLFAYEVTSHGTVRMYALIPREQSHTRSLYARTVLMKRLRTLGSELLGWAGFANTCKYRC